MINVIRKIFNSIFKIDKFLSENKLFDFNGACIIFTSAFLFVGIGELVQDKLGLNLIKNIAVFYLGSAVYMIIPYVIIKHGEIKKYYVFGEKENSNVIIKRLELRSYIIFLVSFSWGLIFPAVGIPMLLRIFHIDFLLNVVLNNLIQIWYINVSLGSFFWFAYQVIILEQELNKVKEKLALLTAIITTISTIISIVIAGDLKIIIAYILLSYAWIRYLIEVKTNTPEV